jgi:AmiR/NasT family two-component response regulator
LEVMVADSSPTAKTFYEECFGRIGQLFSIAGTGTQLVELCRLLQPGLLVVQARLPERDGVSAAAGICKDRPLPVIMLVDPGDAEAMPRILENPNILAVLENPVRMADLAAAVPLAVCRFRQWQECLEEAAAMRRTLEERKLIERAKGTLMRRTGLDEGDAYRRMRKLASHRNLKMAEIAQEILLAEETFVLLEQIETTEKAAFTAIGRNRPAAPPPA